MSDKILVSYRTNMVILREVAQTLPTALEQDDGSTIALLIELCSELLSLWLDFLGNIISIRLTLNHGPTPNVNSMTNLEDESINKEKR